MRKIAAVLVVLLALTVAAGCGNKEQKAAETAKPETAQTAPKAKINLLRDAEALTRFQDDVKEKFGDDFKVFRGTFGGTIHIYHDRIRFDAVDPENTKHVNRYTWTNSKGFAEPEPVKVKTVGSSAAIEDYASYQDSFKGVDFTKVAVFMAETEKKATEEEFEGAKPLTSVSIDYRKGKHVISGSLSGTRKDARVAGDPATGAVTQFTVK